MIGIIYTHIGILPYQTQRVVSPYYIIIQIDAIPYLTIEIFYCIKNEAFTLNHHITMKNWNKLMHIINGNLCNEFYKNPQEFNKRHSEFLCNYTNYGGRDRLKIIIRDFFDVDLEPSVFKNIVYQKFVNHSKQNSTIVAICQWYYRGKVTANNHQKQLFRFLQSLIKPKFERKKRILEMYEQKKTLDEIKNTIYSEFNEVSDNVPSNSFRTECNLKNFVPLAGTPMESLPLKLLFQFWENNYIISLRYKDNREILREKSLLEKNLTNKKVEIELVLDSIKKMERLKNVPITSKGPSIRKINKTAGLKSIYDIDKGSILWRRSEEVKNIMNKLILQYHKAPSLNFKGFSELRKTFSLDEYWLGYYFFISSILSDENIIKRDNKTLYSSILKAITIKLAKVNLKAGDSPSSNVSTEKTSEIETPQNEYADISKKNLEERLNTLQKEYEKMVLRYEDLRNINDKIEAEEYKMSPSESLNFIKKFDWKTIYTFKDLEKPTEKEKEGLKNRLAILYPFKRMEPTSVRIYEEGDPDMRNLNGFFAERKLNQKTIDKIMSMPPLYTKETSYRTVKEFVPSKKMGRSKYDGDTFMGYKEWTFDLVGRVNNLKADKISNIICCLYNYKRFPCVNKEEFRINRGLQLLEAGYTDFDWYTSDITYSNVIKKANKKGAFSRIVSNHVNKVIKAVEKDRFLKELSVAKKEKILLNKQERRAAEIAIKTGDYLILTKESEINISILKPKLKNYYKKRKNQSSNKVNLIEDKIIND